VLGITFVVGGTQINEFQFSSMIAQTLSSFMFVATGSLILPAAFDAGLPESVNAREGVLELSRGTAVVLLIIYILFLVYQLKTHTHVFNTEDLDEEGASEAQVAPWASAVTILIVTTAVSFCSDYLVGSIDDVVQSFGISKTFIGLILVPIVGNAGTSNHFTSLTEIAETVTCISLGYKIKMDLVVAITLGSCMQIALFLTPFLVILGWIINVPMTLSKILSSCYFSLYLDFEIFQAVVIFISVVFTEYLIMDGSSNWMEGSMLLGVYSIVAISYWLYPDLT
jgi:Ca2+:H+ antiporter